MWKQLEFNELIAIAATHQREKERVMLKILHKSTEPCFICKSREKVTMVKGDSFSLALCMTHLWEKVPEVEKGGKRSETTEKSADALVSR
ncbi:MAG TPA: hypothetical protein VFI31_03475 [Pirellulales bacterium]|nr:hypothetical protein [Pirellulales bacterium]